MIIIIIIIITVGELQVAMLGHFFHRVPTNMTWLRLLLRYNPKASTETNYVGGVAFAT